MNNSYDTLLSHLRKLPGLGYRSAERIAIHLLTDKVQSGKDLIQAIEDAQMKLSPCEDCGAHELPWSKADWEQSGGPKRPATFALLSTRRCATATLPGINGMSRGTSAASGFPSGLWSTRGPVSTMSTVWNGPIWCVGVSSALRA